MLRHLRHRDIFPCLACLEPHRLPTAGSREEHTFVLREPGGFDLLRRKNDLFEEGVSTVFGILGERALLQAFCFDADRFTADQAREWLSQRGLEPCLYTSKTPSTEELTNDRTCED